MHPTPEEIATVLGGRALRRRVREADDLALLVRRGLPVHTVRRLAHLVGRSPAERQRIVTVIGLRTALNRQARQRQSLSHEGSRRAVRVARLIALSESVLGSADAASTYLMRPHPLLKERAPIDLARTEKGTRQVEDILRRIEFSLPA